MRCYTVECASPEANVFIYADPEFAIVMGPEIEDDPSLENEEDVVRLHMRRGDKHKIEWLGMELVDGEIVNYLKFVQDFGINSFLEGTEILHQGWVPSSRLDLRSPHQDGLRIFRLEPTMTNVTGTL